MRLRVLIESGLLQDVVMHFKSCTHISFRKKLEPELEKAFVLKISDSLSRDRVQNPPSEVQSMLGSEAPPWAEAAPWSETPPRVAAPAAVSAEAPSPHGRRGGTNASAVKTGRANPPAYRRPARRPHVTRAAASSRIACEKRGPYGHVESRLPAARRAGGCSSRFPCARPPADGALREGAVLRRGEP